MELNRFKAEKIKGTPEKQIDTGRAMRYFRIRSVRSETRELFLSTSAPSALAGGNRAFLRNLLAPGAIHDCANAATFKNCVCG
jgi:hypothetical protein